MRYPTPAMIRSARSIMTAYERGAAAADDPEVEAVGAPYKSIDHRMAWRSGLNEAKAKRPAPPPAGAGK